MSNAKLECRVTGCDKATRATSRRCERHRKPIPVSMTPDGLTVHIGGQSCSANAARELADRIHDVIEATTTTTEE